MSMKKAFKQFMKKEQVYEHLENCPNDRFFPGTPINEAPCDCYDQHIFSAGYKAAKGIAK